MLVIHFTGLAMGLGTSLAHMFLGIASSKMEPEDAVKFRLQTFALAKMGHLGLFLLVLSGFYLMSPYWYMLSSTPLLIAKLILVLILGGLIGVLSSMAKKAKQGDAALYLKKMEPIGKTTLLIGITIVILAVLVFH